MEVTIGYWAIPAAITLVAMTWAIVWGNREMGSSSGYGSIGAGMGAALILLLAVIVSLIAWMIYGFAT